MEQAERLSDPLEIRRLCMQQIKSETETYVDGSDQDKSDTSDSRQFSSAEIMEALRRNEDGDAKLYVELHRGRLCFDTTAGRWYIWGSHHWQEDILNDALRVVGDVVEAYLIESERVSWSQHDTLRRGSVEEGTGFGETRKSLLKRIASLQAIKRKENILKLARTGTGSLAITGDEWDCNPLLLGVKNGTVDLRTGELRAGKPADFIKTVSPVEYRGLNQPASTWEKFQLEICNGNIGLVHFKQRLFGYAITGLTSEQKFPIQLGEGGNGKSTENETIAAVLGDYAGQIESEMLLAQRNGRNSAGPSPDIMALRGKRFLICSETEQGRYFNVSKLKWLTGGDSLVGRNLYERKIVTFTPSHKIFLNTNHRPHVGEDDFAFWRRALLIPYPLSFASEPGSPNERKADPHLIDKLKEDYPGILAWLIRGCLAWQKEGLNPPDCVKAATLEYRSDEDAIGRFIEDRCSLGPDKMVRAQVLYSKYQSWCKNIGQNPLSMTSFCLRIKTRFKADKKEHGVRYLGIGLIDGGAA